MIKRYLLVLVLIFGSVQDSLWSQVGFDHKSDFLDVGKMYSGLPVGVVDMNNDLLDDLVFLSQGTDLMIAYQNWNDDQFSTHAIDEVGERPQWSMTVADLDKNGWRDIIIAGAYDDLKIYYQDNGTFEKTIIYVPELYAQAMSLADIDQDSYLDIFICNDIGYNMVFWNKGDHVVPDTSGLFADLPKEFALGNYGAEWVDIEGDGDMDLYLAKCHAFAQTPDPSRINRLYINDGTGGFSEEAASRGVASEEQSWTGHFFDSDSDGDMDLLVTNHNVRAQLFHNDGSGRFVEVTDASNLQITGPVIQSLNADFNCDGEEDLVIGGVPHFLYMCSPDGSYQLESTSLGLYDLTTLSIGDLNNDGRPDIFGSVLEPLEKPSTLGDRLLLNTNRDNWLNVYLQGYQSSSECVNAVVRVYTDDKVLTKSVRSGESYGVQSTHKLMFGLGEKEVVDSIVISWPNKTKTKISSIRANHYVVAHISGRYVKQEDCLLPVRDTICQGSVLYAEGPRDARSYEWNGEAGEFDKIITDEGFYQLQVEYDDDVTIKLPGVSVFHEPNWSTVIEIQGDTISCLEEKVILTHASGYSVEWSTGDVGKELIVERSGWYGGSVKGRCGTFQLEDSYIEFLPDDELFYIRSDTVKRGETGSIESNWDETHWFRDSIDDSPFHIGRSLIVDSVEGDSIYYAEPVTQTLSRSFRIGPSPQLEQLTPHKDILNATMIFDVLEPCILDTVTICTEVPGMRRVVLLNESLEIVGERLMVLDTGCSRVALGFALVPEDGRYRMTTDSDVNEDQFGTRSPQLLSLYEGVGYPYIEEEVIRIIESQYGWDQFNYFFDWAITRLERVCSGTRVRCGVYLDSTTASRDLESIEVVLVPNPSVSSVKLLSVGQLHDLQLLSTDGRLLGDSTIFIRTEDGYVLSRSLSPGLYFIRWKGGQARMVVGK